MKKLILLACITVLIGAGCTKAPKQTSNNQTAPNTPAPAVGEKKTRPPEVNITPEENAALETTFAAKSEETGFKVYYPTFVPENLQVNKDSLLVNNAGTGKIITYNLSAKNSATPQVYIQEQTQGMELDPNIPEQQEAVYLKGYIKTIKNDAGEFYVLVFVKDEKTTIRMSVKTDVMDADTLSKIAESMK